MTSMLQRLVIASTFFRRAPVDSRVEAIRYGLLPSIKTTMVCVVVCAWDYVVEVYAPPGCAGRLTLRTWLLIAPQAMLLAAFYLHAQVILHYKRRCQRVLVFSVFALYPIGLVALAMSVFRMSMALCCCTPFLCPISSAEQPVAAMSACSRIFDNCFWGWVRKVIHFLGTVGCLGPLLTLTLSVFSTISQETRAKACFGKFLEKTKSF